MRHPETGREVCAQFAARSTSILESRQGRTSDARVEWSHVTTSDLITRARAGDRDAFRELTEPHRPELLVHCYRMLGSFQDAEDALQDALLSAWQALDGFEGRASIRTWLYRRSRLGLVKSHGSSHIPTRVS